MKQKSYRRCLLAASLFCVSTLGLPIAAQAQTAPTLSAEQRGKKLQELKLAYHKAREENAFVKAAEIALQGHALERKNGGLAYDAACAYALAGQPDLAFTWLTTSAQLGYTDTQHIKQDSDLKSLHEDKRWTAYLSELEQIVNMNARLWKSKAWHSNYSEQLSEDQRIAGLSKFWSEVKYNFVFTDTLKQLDWDAVYLQYLPRVKAARSTLEYYTILMEMSALLKDGHTSISPPVALYASDLCVPPFRTRLIEDKVIITELADPGLRAMGVKEGVEITRVDGQPVKAWAEKNLLAYISASTAQDLQQRLYGSQFLRGKLSEKPLLEFNDGKGKSWSAALSRVTWQQRNAALPAKPAFSWKMLQGDVAYVALNSFADDTAAREYLKNFPEISKAKAIIFDIRENGGGSSTVGYKVLATLSDQQLAVNRSETRDYKPTYRAWGRNDENYQFEPWTFPPDAQFQFKGKVAVLISAATYSAAEDFAVAFDNMKRGQLIGQASGGSTGQPLLFSLPGGGAARVCTKKDSYPDGKAFVGVGVQPQQSVKPRLSDFRQGRDTVLEAALASLQ